MKHLIGDISTSITRYRNRFVAWLNSLANWPLVFFLLMVTFGLSLYMTLERIKLMDTLEASVPASKHAVFAPQGVTAPTTKTVSVPLIGKKGFIAHVTGFSSVECDTTWCNANEGKSRGLKVALNKLKYGSQWTKVYVPAFDTTYDVIGSTDQNTDLDIWFGSDYAAAKQFGSKTLLINLIK